jgi:hypothetical protein
VWEHTMCAGRGVGVGQRLLVRGTRARGLVFVSCCRHTTHTHLLHITPGCSLQG